MTEVELIEACRRGDRDAFARVVERYQRMVEAVAFGATGDPAIVDDVVQDAFVCAWQTLDTLRDPARVRPWLRAIARNIGCKARRRRVREAPLVETPSSRTPFDDASERERDEKIITALRGLPARYREPLVLFYYESCTVAEVAHTLGLREDLVLQRLSRGRKRLGDVLALDVEIGLERRPSRVALAGVVVALVAGMRTEAAGAVAVRAVGEGGAGTWLAAASTWLVRVAPTLRVVGAGAAVVGAVALVLWGAERSQDVAVRSAAQPPVAWPSQDSEVTTATAPPPQAAHPAASSTVVHQSVSVASPDPVESCARATRNLARRLLDKDAIVQIGGELHYRPDPDLQRTVEEIGERVGSTCDVGTWPELYVVCEGTVDEIIDGNITCYPYDPFA